MVCNGSLANNLKRKQITVWVSSPGATYGGTTTDDFFSIGETNK